MKLKTEITSSGPVNESRPLSTFQALEHDAAAAHALMQSLNEHVGDHTNLSLCITRRAGDILAEWGYGEE